jgi:uncharacterized protein YkwD
LVLRADLSGMRGLAVSTLAGFVLFAASTSAATASAPRAWQPRATADGARPTALAGRTSILSAYESSVLTRINALRGVRGLRALRISRGLTAAATYHTNQMGLRGFFEHQSLNGAAFWKRIERFYPSRRYQTWSVGENLLWSAPDIAPASAVREWMESPPHRENLLSREWREVGLAAIHFSSAPGEYEGRAVTIVTADFGSRA